MDPRCADTPVAHLTLQATDEEAVDPDQLAGPGDVDVLLGAGIPRRLIGSGGAGAPSRAT